MEELFKIGQKVANKEKIYYGPQDSMDADYIMTMLSDGFELEGEDVVLPAGTIMTYNSCEFCDNFIIGKNDYDFCEVEKEMFLELK